MTTQIWTFALDKNTNHFINTNPIKSLIDKIKYECEYKEDIMDDFHENNKRIHDLEANSDNLFNIEKLHILSDLHLYRDDYFKVLEDMEQHIRQMLRQIKKLSLAKFTIRKTNLIMRYISTTF